MAATIFVPAAFSWVFMPIPLDATGSALNISDSLIAIAAAALPSLTPTDVRSGKRLFDWKTANDLPWDVLLPLDGGLPLSAVFSKLGLPLWIGEQVKGLGTLPTLAIIAAIATLITFLTEFTPNTTAAVAFPPIMDGAAMGIGVIAENPMNTLLFVMSVAPAVTFAFMPPVATPPNVVTYGSGYIKVGDMTKTGLWLNIAGVAPITVVVLLIGAPVFSLIL